MPFQLTFQSRPVRLIQFLPAKRLFEQERRMGGILTRCFQASQDHLLLLNASRYFDELSLSPLKIVRYCLPVHAAPRREFQRNIGTPQCSTTQVKRVHNPPKVSEAGYTSTSELPLAGSISCMCLSHVEPEYETSPTGLSGAAYRRLISTRQTSFFARN